MTRIYVADTNLFFECKRLEDLPWEELEGDPIVIALTRPVLNEVDRHKNGTGRTRRRAIETNGRIRDLLDQGIDEVAIREQGPRVMLRLEMARKPAPEHADMLDYGVNDDRIVGIVAAMAQDSDVVLLTGDTGPAATARSVGLTFFMIPDRWRRPPPETDEAKRVRELEQDIAAYRAQEPDIEVKLAEPGPKEVVNRIAEPLDAATVDRLIARIEQDHPMKTSFVAPEPETHPDGTRVTYAVPDEAEVEAYKTEAYPAWLEQCRSILSSLHEGRDEPEAAIKLRFEVSNRGTRPASHVRIAFEATGAVEFRRAAFNESADEAEEAVDRPSPPGPRLPSPPRPPVIERTVTRPRPATRTTADSLPAASSLGFALSGLHHPSLIDQINQISPLLRAVQEQEPKIALFKSMTMPEHVQAALNTTKTFADHIEQHRLKTARAITVPDFGTLRPILPHPPPAHDPEAFYFDDWPPEVPVRTGALTCDLFRHQNGTEAFQMTVVLPEEGNAAGSVLCTVHAENLTKPETLRVPVRRTVERFDLAEIAEAMVSELENVRET